MRRIGIIAWYLAGHLLLNLSAFSASTTPTATQVQPHPLDTTPPTGTIVINANAAYTTTPAVTLTLAATDNSGTVAKMRFSNDNVTYTAPEPYATPKRWQLASGDGTKTVYAKFADGANNWSQPVSDTTILDTMPPVVQITDPVDGQTFGAQ